MDKRPKWFKDFLGNDWKHMNWKVNLMIGLLSMILVAVIARFITG